MSEAGDLLQTKVWDWQYVLSIRTMVITTQWTLNINKRTQAKKH